MPGAAAGTIGAVAPASRAERIEQPRAQPEVEEPAAAHRDVECINCDACLRHCPPQFGAIFNHGPDVVIIPELCSGCDKCLPACPVDCIYPFPEWERPAYPDEWWDEPLSRQRPLP